MAYPEDKKVDLLLDIGRIYFDLQGQLKVCQLYGDKEPCDWTNIPDKYLELPPTFQKSVASNVLFPNRLSLFGRGELSANKPCEAPSQASFKGHILEMFPSGLTALRVERMLFTKHTGPIIEERISNSDISCMFPDIVAGKPYIPEECKQKPLVTRKVIVSQEMIDHFSAMAIASSIINISNPSWNQPYIDCFTFALHTQLIPEFSDSAWMLNNEPPTCAYRNEYSKEYSEKACANPAEHLLHDYRPIDIREEKAEIGDRIVYLRFRSSEDKEKANNPNFILPWNNDLSINHIGIVTSVDENGIPNEVLSKFGSSSHAIISDAFTNRADYGDIFIIVRQK